MWFTGAATASLAPLLLLFPGCQAIWPVPKSLTTGNTTLFIDQTLKVTYNGEQLAYTSGYAPPAGPDFSSKEMVQAALSRSLDSIFRHNFVPWMLRPHGADFEPGTEDANKTRVTSLAITQDGDDDENTHRGPAGAASEAYKLSLSESGEAVVSASNSLGIARALETFSQLFFQHSSGTHWYAPHAPYAVEDEPKYPHRGLLLDTARSFFPVDDILRTIDALAWNKMNRLHLHITDSQSWPLEIPALPELAEKGAYARGMTYTAEDLARIQAHALHRGVQPIIEIDMPGHIGILSLSHPELIAAHNAAPYHWYCAQPPCGAFKLNDSAVFDLLGKLWDDLLPRTAPYSSYFHMGGDEYKLNNSLLDDGLETNDPAVLQPLMQRFVDTVHDRFRQEGLVPMVWEEMITDWNVTLGKDVVIQSWLGAGAVEELAAAGHKVIDSDYSFWYLDCGRNGQWLNFDNGPAYDAFYPFNDWCTPAKSWRLMYTHDPAAGLDDAAAANVLGGEATMWSETTDTATLDSMLWPRLGAVAEVLWSGNAVNGKNRSQLEVAPRLAEMRERLVARGVASGSVQMPFCTQGGPKSCEHVM